MVPEAEKIFNYVNFNFSHGENDSGKFVRIAISLDLDMATDMLTDINT